MIGRLWRVRDWPVRRKVVALLVGAAVVPLVTAAVLQVRATRASLIDASGELLRARAEQLRRQLETLELGYQQTAEKIARGPAIVGYRDNPAPVRAVLDLNVTLDRELLALGVVEPSGTVRVATEPRLEGTVPAGELVARALHGSPALSDLFVAGPALDDTPALAVAAPTPDRGAVVIWIRASAVWGLARSSNELAGRGSFAVITDELGLRVAHSMADRLVLRPSAPLAPAVAAQLVRERRFGADTGHVIADVQPFPELHRRAVAPYPDTAVFHGVAPGLGRCIGVASRLSTSRWTVFYFLPERVIDDEVTALSRDQAAIVGAITLAVFGLGMVIATLLLRPIAALAAATARIGGGDLSARTDVEPGRDELGQLALSFDAMAARIERDAAELRRSHDELEARVAERTARLALISRCAHELAAASGEASEVLALAVDRIGASVGDVCAIRLISDDGAWLEAPAAIYRGDAALGAKIVAALGDGRLPLATSMGGRVAASGQAQLVPAITDELARAVPVLRRLVDEVGVTSLLAVPLRSRDRVIGVVTLLRVTPERPYTLDDQGLVQELSDRAGLAIDNAVLVATLERRVAARTAALEAANDELEAFSYSVSHDLRAPLRAIDGFSEVLLAEHAAQLDAGGQAALRRVRAATRRMAALIDDLLTLARITRSEPRWTDVDLSALAEQIAGELRRRDPARTTAIHVAPGLRHRGDARLLAIALENLLGNAWKFTAKHPAAEIWFEVHDGAFRVRDTGAGFDMAYADKLFAPFHRLHAASDYEGTGIGLATVQRIVQRHHGRIWADATPDRGAAFSFTLGEPS